MARATCSGVWTGGIARTLRPVWFAAWSKNGVSIVTGSTLHTWIPRSPSRRSSWRRLALSARTANFVAE